jgi:hypothetical protein
VSQCYDFLDLITRNKKQNPHGSDILLKISKKTKKGGGREKTKGKKTTMTVSNKRQKKLFCNVVLTKLSSLVSGDPPTEC